jgi:hypothetical protein
LVHEQTRTIDAILNINERECLRREIRKYQAIKLARTSKLNPQVKGREKPQMLDDSVVWGKKKFVTTSKNS